MNNEAKTLEKSEITCAQALLELGESNKKLRLQRDMLLDTLKPIIEYPGIREYIGSILADKACAAIAKYRQRDR